jgi:hypothetical protein
LLTGGIAISPPRSTNLRYLLRHRWSPPGVAEEVDVNGQARSTAALEGVQLDHQAAYQAPALMGAESLGEFEGLCPKPLRFLGRRVDVDDAALGHLRC